jgi:methionine synthase II (cobalamin-independent)
MLDITKTIREETNLFYQIIMDSIEDYTYRAERYNVQFGIVSIYSKEKIDTQKLQSLIRKTDKIIVLSENLCCVALDSTSDISYIKAAENLNRILNEINYKDLFYLGAVDSQDFKSESRKMINYLFSRLEYALENNLSDMVIYQEYEV